MGTNKHRDKPQIDGTMTWWWSDHHNVTSKLASTAEEMKYDQMMVRSSFCHCNAWILITLWWSDHHFVIRWKSPFQTTNAIYWSRNELWQNDHRSSFCTESPCQSLIDDDDPWRSGSEQDDNLVYKMTGQHTLIYIYMYVYIFIYQL